MAAHLHTQIRAALVTALTGLASTGANVFANRLAQLGPAQLPGLVIRADEEAAEPISIHGPTYERRLSVSLDIFAKAIDGVDDLVEQVAAEVEVALAAGLAIAGKPLHVIYAGMSYDDEPADQAVARKTLRYDITFTAMSNAPDILI